MVTPTAPVAIIITESVSPRKRSSKLLLWDFLFVGYIPDLRGNNTLQ